MDIENLIGFPKDVVLKTLEKENVKFEICTFDENQNFDTLLLTRIEEKGDGVVLFFDKFIFSVENKTKLL